MQFHRNSGASFARLLPPEQNERFRERFVAIAEPCKRKPPVFYDARYGTRAPWGALVRYFRQAFSAAETREAQGRVVEEVTAFALELIADARSWLGPAPLTLREVVMESQQADGDEDVAESAFLSEQTQFSAENWIRAIRRERAKGEVLELKLLQIARGKTNDGPRAA
jgi:hypothetical protein